MLCLAGIALFVRGNGFTAREAPSGVESYIARRLRDFAIPSAFKEARNPLDATELAVAEGRDHFADHCAICHANDGTGRTEMGANLYPPAPDMRASLTQSLTDGELFYLIRNGVPFTGMPGWGGEDEENWKLVLFIRHLPEIQPVELGFMDEINHLGTGEPEH
jgi:mono/diheme cytochrome c family protein